MAINNQYDSFDLYSYAIMLTNLCFSDLFAIFLASQVLIVVAPAVLAAQGTSILFPSLVPLVF